MQRGVVSIFGVASRFFVAMSSRGKLFGVVSTWGFCLGTCWGQCAGLAELKNPHPTHTHALVSSYQVSRFSAKVARGRLVFQTKGSATLFLPAVCGYLLILGERRVEQR